MTETHIELPGSRRPAKKGARRLRDVDPQAPVEVTITLRAPPLPTVEAFPASPMTPKEFASEYGANLADVQKVERVFAHSG